MDVLLLGFIAGFGAAGYRTGFIRRLAGLGFIALSVVLGAYLRVPVGTLISNLFNVPQGYAEMVAYIFIFPTIVVIAHVLTNSILSHVAVSGLSREADQILGTVFGIVEGVLLISVFVVILDTYFGPKASLAQAAEFAFLRSLRNSINASTTVDLLRRTTVPTVLAVLGPLLPADVTSFVPTGIPGLPPQIPGLPTPTPRPT